MITDQTTSEGNEKIANNETNNADEDVDKVGMNIMIKIFIKMY